MDISKLYTKFRKDFGRQSMFSEVPVHLLDSINPDVREQRNYCLRNPVSHEAQTNVNTSENYVNTKIITKVDQGVNHAEGGWPKEIHFADEELTSRYRRRYERDDGYVDAVLNSYPKFLHYINQNNGVEMYEKYFKNMTPIEPVEKVSFCIKAVCKDSDNRPVACMNWTHEDESKVAISYCDKKCPGTQSNNTKTNLLGHIWDFENPIYPCNTFLPPTACWQLACPPIHPSLILGGLEDGRICIFDLRVHKEAVTISPLHLAHRDPVSALVFMQSRVNTEFFSGSTDGMCMWWDIRNISFPTDSLVMSVRIPPGKTPSLENAEGVTALQYDRAFPTRFLCGTDTGFVINVNRKGKSHQEIMSATFHTQSGPVRAVHRSPCTSKMFITCGDWTAHIWSEDVHSSPIITSMPHRYQIFDVVWCPQRYSSYMSVSADGKFRYWDILRKYHEPVIILPVSKHPLLKINPNKEGRFIAIGDVKGNLFLLSLSENLVYSGDEDKRLMNQVYERETKREYILETRIKEIRLKFKAEEQAVADTVYDMKNEDAELKIADDEYRRIVGEEMRSMSIVPAKENVMRKR